MNIKEELVKLYNALSTIETKGIHTKTMANCLNYIEQLVNHEEPKQEEPKQEESKEKVDNKK